MISSPLDIINNKRMYFGNNLDYNNNSMFYDKGIHNYLQIEAKNMTRLIWIILI